MIYRNKICIFLMCMKQFSKNNFIIDKHIITNIARYTYNELNKEFVNKYMKRIVKHAESTEKIMFNFPRHILYLVIIPTKKFTSKYIKNIKFVKTANYTRWH